MFLRKPTPKEKSFLDMPSCINDIIDNWCKQRATVCATTHGRPYTPGTSHDGSLGLRSKSHDVVKLRAGALATEWPFCKCAGACMVNIRLTHAAGPFFTGHPGARSWTVQTHSVFPAPPGTKVSDVQSGGRVDPCQVQFYKKVVLFEDHRFLVLNCVQSVLQ